MTSDSRGIRFFIAFVSVIARCDCSILHAKYDCCTNLDSDDHADSRRYCPPDYAELVGGVLSSSLCSSQCMDQCC